MSTPFRVCSFCKERKRISLTFGQTQATCDECQEKYFTT